jgi:hypothetical protein
MQSPRALVCPLLFIIYVNNTQKSKSSRAIMYACDTSILNVEINLKELEIATSKEATQYF